MPCFALPCLAVPGRAMPRHAVPSLALPCPARPSPAVPRHAAPDSKILQIVDGHQRARYWRIGVSCVNRDRILYALLAPRLK